MFIPIVIPTSVQTDKKWIIEMMSVRFLGGYLITLLGLSPPFIAGFLIAEILCSFLPLLADKWSLTTFFAGLALIFWNKWLRFSYATQIKLVFIPLEYFSYIFIFISLVLVYVK